MDPAVSVAIGGNCLSDIGVVRAERGVLGLEASDPTVSRLIDTLAADAGSALTAINTARAEARSAAWRLAGQDAPDHDIDRDRPLITDLDATLITAHSMKKLAAPNFKRDFGFHPLGAWADHGQGRTPR